MLKDERKNLADALDQLGKFGALAADSVNQTKENLVKELQNIGPVLQSAGRCRASVDPLTRFLLTFPFPKPTLE